MNTTITIDLDDYLSESEKKQYAIEAFKEAIKKELFKSQSGTIQSDSEAQRIISNISHQIVFEEVQKYIPDCEQKIKDKVIDVIEKEDYKYNIFKKKDVWDKEESLAITYMNETIRANKEIFQQRIKEYIENYDLSTDISDEVSRVFDELAGYI
jgi:hypothetical protein